MGQERHGRLLWRLLAQAGRLRPHLPAHSDQHSSRQSSLPAATRLTAAAGFRLSNPAPPQEGQCPMQLLTQG